MSSQATPPLQEYRSDVTDATPGDRVDLATTNYDYATPLTIVGTSKPSIWEVPYGRDWLIREFELDGSQGGTYYVVYNTARQMFELHDADDVRIADITQFALVDDDEDSEDVDGADDEDDQDTEDDDSESSTVSWTTASSDDTETQDDEDAAADGGPQTKYSTGGVDLDPDEHAPDQEDDTEDEEWDMSFPIPDGVTKQRVRSAVQGSLSLQGVLERLEWPDGDEHAKGRVRALVFDLGLYDDLTSPESWDREQANKRGWE